MPLTAAPWEGVLTEEAVRRKLEPTGQLVTRLTFAPGTKLKASALERLAIVTAGQCRLTAKGESVTLAKGETTTLPAGPYELEVLSAETLELLIAFRLPEAVLQRGRS